MGLFRESRAWAGRGAGWLLILALAAVVAPQSRCQSVFAAPETFNLNDSPRSVAAADVNGDGHPDLIVAGGPSGGVIILLGDGHGGFGTPRKVFNGSAEGVAYYQSSAKSVLLATDAQVGTGSLAVFSGNGDGTFSSIGAIPVGSVPDAVAVGSVKGDGKPDFFVANLLSNTLTGVLTGGTGAITIRVGKGPAALAVADLNGDGKADLITANQGGAGTVSIRLSQGDGTFKALPDVPAVLGATGLAVGDFNGDGKPDLAVTGGDQIAVLLGNGDGTFHDPIFVTAGSLNSVLAVGDFNNDGKLDLAVGGGGGLYLLFGNGDGTFQSPDQQFIGRTPYGLAVGDFNGDGKADLAVTDRSSGTVTVLIQQVAVQPPAFSSPVSYNTDDGSSSVAIGDINGDGKPDLVVSNDGGVFAGGSLTILMGKGDGTFQSLGNTAMPIHPESVALGDFNGDGKLDLAVAGLLNGTGYLLLGNGDGTFKKSATFRTGLGPQFLVVGDFDGDGKLDLASANTGASDVAEFRGNGDGTLQAPRVVPGGALPYGIVAADFNHDGKTDIAEIDHADNVQDVTVYLGGGGKGARYAGGRSPSGIAEGDFNHDGIPDLAVADSGSGNLTVLLGNGDGTFRPAGSFAGAGDGTVAVGDFDGDGNLDLAVVNSSGGPIDPNTGIENGSIAVLLGQGDGQFHIVSTYDAGPNPGVVAVSDFNGDGEPDIAVTDRVDGQVRILLNQTPSKARLLPGDLNGDGRVNIQDATLALQAVVGLTTLTPAQVAAADIDGDSQASGKIDVKDVTLILRKAVGL